MCKLGQEEKLLIIATLRIYNCQAQPQASNKLTKRNGSLTSKYAKLGILNKGNGVLYQQKLFHSAASAHCVSSIEDIKFS